MEDINAKILQQGFGIKLISAYRTRTGLVCKTDRGMPVSYTHLAVYKRQVLR